MKNAILIISFCISSFCFSQNKFNKSIEQLEKDFEYFPVSKIENKSFSKNSFVETKKFCEEFESKKTEINFNEFISAKSVRIKSKKPLSGNTYLRLTIEEWGFENERNALKFEKKFKELDLDCLNKGGIEYWRINKKIYLILSPAKMFSYEFGKIKKSLNKKLE